MASWTAVAAYILTYDSDPEDLSATALPMAELCSRWSAMNAL